MGQHDGVDLEGKDRTYPKEITTATKGNSGESHQTWTFKRQLENSRTGGTLMMPDWGLSRTYAYGIDRNRTISCMTRVFWSV